jgi:hypothetical protein
MTDQHPITPPLELVQQWWTDAQTLESNDSQEIRFIANVAARWGADQELDACCAEMKSLPSPLGIPFGEMASNALRTARRPKPPSLKEQALTALHAIAAGANDTREQHQDLETLRHAIEALPND